MLRMARVLRVARVIRNSFLTRTRVHTCTHAHNSSMISLSLSFFLALSLLPLSSLPLDSSSSLSLSLFLSLSLSLSQTLSRSLSLKLFLPLSLFLSLSHTPFLWASPTSLSLSLFLSHLSLPYKHRLSTPFRQRLCQCWMWVPMFRVTTIECSILHLDFISSTSILNRWSISLGLFVHVPLKRDQEDWNRRVRLNCTPSSICLYEYLMSCANICVFVPILNANPHVPLY